MSHDEQAFKVRVFISDFNLILNRSKYIDLFIVLDVLIQILLILWTYIVLPIGPTNLRKISI